MLIKNKRILFGKEDMILYPNKNTYSKGNGQVVISHLEEQYSTRGINITPLNGDELINTYRSLINKYQTPTANLVSIAGTIAIEEEYPYEFLDNITSCIEDNSRIFSYQDYIFDLSECNDETINSLLSVANKMGEISKQNDN